MKNASFRQAISTVGSFVLAALVVGCGSQDAAKPKADIQGQTKIITSQPSQPQDSAPVVKEDPAPKSPKNESPPRKTAEDAKAELQKRINRFLGGERKDVSKLIGSGMALNSAGADITQIEILNLVQEVGNDGAEWPNQFVGNLRYEGRRLSGGPAKGQTPIRMEFVKGEWDVH